MTETRTDEVTANASTPEAGDVISLADVRATIDKQFPVPAIGKVAVPQAGGEHQAPEGDDDQAEVHQFPSGDELAAARTRLKQAQQKTSDIVRIRGESVAGYPNVA